MIKKRSCKGKNNPFYGKHHTKETRKELSEKLKGHTHGFKKGNIPWNKGISCREETKKKLSLTSKKAVSEGRIKPFQKGNIFGNRFKSGHPYEFKKGEHISPETEFKKGMIPWNKGETKETKISLETASEKMTGHPYYGPEKHSDETKIKISIANRDWDFYNKYGCTKKQYPYNSNWTDDFKEMIRNRDGNKCVVSGITNEEHKEKYGCSLFVHHWTYDKDETNPFYFVTVSNSINAMAQKNKAQWIDLFNGVMEEKYCELLLEGSSLDRF